MFAKTRSMKQHHISAEKRRQRVDAALQEWIVSWVTLAVLSCLATACWLVYQQETMEPPRFLWEDSWNDDVIPQQPQQGEYHSHHHSVISEAHKPLYPLAAADVWGFALAITGLLLAAGGGVGGGGMLVPIYCLVMGFSPKHAIPLSNVTVLGGSVANTVLNWSKRHPLADRNLIDWDLILAMEPLTIAGALMGAILNKLLPELLLIVLLVLLLSVTARKTLTRAFKMYKAETRKLQPGLRSDGTRESELTRLANKDMDDEEEEEEEDSDQEEEEEELTNEEVPTTKAQAEELQQRKDQLARIMEDERHPPRTNIQILLVLFVVVLTLNLLKGGGAFRSPLNITCGSTSFWMANLTLLVWILLVACQARALLLRKHRAKLECGYEYADHDIIWDERSTVVYPCVCCIAGFFAGMFGIGGGIVKGPLMLAMGVHPAVSSATSACMILFTSFTATTSFVVFGLLLGDYAVLCFFVGLIATTVGQVVLGILMKRAGGRSSYIAFSIGFVVLVSAILMTVQSLLSIASGEHHHSGGICGKGD